ncbi:hypothetical protein L1987_36057 [Smallanthus sonchifolius]|uniref:Uncharacterized protein n=1 Tax=Smallanthus sonchifolius TaxID=185202 RepID=A0ACB9HDD0_9ASTR|nr:hypothetical protein L1987_36057 [Smallanthus sonchifolius]
MSGTETGSYPNYEGRCGDYCSISIEARKLVAFTLLCKRHFYLSKFGFRRYFKTKEPPKYDDIVPISCSILHLQFKGPPRHSLSLAVRTRLQFRSVCGWRCPLHPQELSSYASTHYATRIHAVPLQNPAHREDLTLVLITNLDKDREGKASTTNRKSFNN